MYCGCPLNCIITWLLTSSCVTLCRPTKSAPCIETGWRPLHPMTAAVKTMTRMTLLSGWYPALAVLSYTMQCRSAWLNTRTGECARARSRLSKTAWWTSKNARKEQLRKQQAASTQSAPSWTTTPHTHTKDCTQSNYSGQINKYKQLQHPVLDIHLRIVFIVQFVHQRALQG